MDIFGRSILGDSISKNFDKVFKDESSLEHNFKISSSITKNAIDRYKVNYKQTRYSDSYDKFPSNITYEINKVYFNYYTIFKFSSSSRDSLKTALSIFQLGEFALVIFELSFAQGLLDQTVVQILIVIVVISMIITPFVLRKISEIADIFNYTRESNNKFEKVDNDTLTNHIVLIGYGRLGKHIAALIQKEGMEFIAIEGDIKTVKDAKKQNLPVVFGNAAQKNILESVNIKDATSVIISIGNSQKLHHICQAVNELTNNTKTIVKVNKFEEKASLDKLNLSHIIVETEKTATAMFDEAMKC